VNTLTQGNLQPHTADEEDIQDNDSISQTSPSYHKSHADPLNTPNEKPSNTLNEKFSNTPNEKLSAFASSPTPDPVNYETRNKGTVVALF